MADHDTDQGLARKSGKPGFIKNSLPMIIVWPILCIILGTALWGTTLSKLKADQNAIEKSALKDVSALTKAYAQHLTRNIEQIDQTTLLIKHGWEKSRGALKLEELLQMGIFPVSRFALVTIIDRDGLPITGTVPMSKPVSVLDREYFNFHKNNNATILLISKPATGRISGKTVIQFTRRLDMADGAFGGVVLISIEPAYLATFHDGSSLGKGGLLAVIGTDGVSRMASIDGVVNAKVPATLRPLPELDPQGGASLWPGKQWFTDSQTRFVAWEPLPAYPLIALVGLSVEERFAAIQATSDTYRHIAIAGSIGLFLFALVAALLSARLAWRNHQEMDVQDAYRLATEGGNDGFYMLRALRDKDGIVVDFQIADCNERGAAFSGYTKAQFVGQTISMVYPKPYFYTVMNTFCGAMESGYYEDELKIPPESPVQLEWVHRRLVRSGTGLAMTMRDITHTKRHERELSRMANEDALTSLPNRNWLMHFLPEKLEQARKANSMLALLFVDLDNFKNVNDSLGHSVGDELLRVAALRLTSILRPTDSVVRLGGDEFTVVLEPILTETEAALVAQRIADIFNQPFELSCSVNAVGASIGISIFPRDGTDVEALLQNSDIAMYRAKAEGKGDYRFYDPSLSHDLKKRLDTEHALQLAIEQDQFILYYQPRVNAFTGELRSMEALVRWQHPARGLVLPLEFIAIAEETGLILKLGELVLEHACMQIARWKALHLQLVPISINVSPYQFNHGDIKNLFASCLARYDLDPRLVEIEITESSMMGEQEEVSGELYALQELGIKLLVDDFGTGYSSLSQLQRLDMDVLKVDRAFTSELGKTTEGEVFFRAIVSMAHALGMSVVAEGVETKAQLQVLQSLSCDEIQGFYVSNPVPADGVPALLAKRFLLPADMAINRRQS